MARTMVSTEDGPSILKGTKTYMDGVKERPDSDGLYNNLGKKKKK